MFLKAGVALEMTRLTLKVLFPHQSTPPLLILVPPWENINSAMNASFNVYLSMHKCAYLPVLNDLFCISLLDCMSL